MLVLLYYLYATNWQGSNTDTLSPCHLKIKGNYVNSVVYDSNKTKMCFGVLHRNDGVYYGSFTGSKREGPGIHKYADGRVYKGTGVAIVGRKGRAATLGGLKKSPSGAP